MIGKNYLQDHVIDAPANGVNLLSSSELCLSEFTKQTKIQNVKQLILQKIGLTRCKEDLPQNCNLTIEEFDGFAWATVIRMFFRKSTRAPDAHGRTDAVDDRSAI